LVAARVSQGVLGKNIGFRFRIFLVENKRYTRTIQNMGRFLSFVGRTFLAGAQNTRDPKHTTAAGVVATTAIVASGCGMLAAGVHSAQNCYCRCPSGRLMEASAVASARGACSASAEVMHIPCTMAMMRPKESLIRTRASSKGWTYWTL
jgi:hypothetical protein